jgi:hypothetical protein
MEILRLLSRECEWPEANKPIESFVTFETTYIIDYVSKLLDEAISTSDRHKAILIAIAA